MRSFETARFIDDVTYKRHYPNRLLPVAMEAGQVCAAIIRLSKPAKGREGVLYPAVIKTRAEMNDYGFYMVKFCYVDNNGLETSQSDLRLTQAGMWADPSIFRVNDNSGQVGLEGFLHDEEDEMDKGLRRLFTELEMPVYASSG